ncbi:MAG TPA: hypothetical protein VFU49_10275 [Ktedonobacteraceae bacterium]|nr:hypothetical protein [Ktedonobacteraceae bacterium]
MTEEQRITKQKQFKVRLAQESDLPTLFVNAVNVQNGLEEFYLTFGTALPIEVRDIEELEQIDTIDARPVFRCVVTRDVMRQFIDLMENIYKQQTQQVDTLRRLQEQKEEG